MEVARASPAPATPLALGPPASAGSRWVELGVAAGGLGVLAVAAFYLYLAEPRLPFHLPGDEAGVVEWAAAGAPILPGDVILEVDGRAFAELRRSRSSDPFRPLRTGQAILLVVERQGERLSIPVSARPWRVTLPLLLFAVAALSFWLAGMLAVLGLRPRGEGWWVLVGCFLLAPLWIAFGASSGSQQALALVLFHAFHWPFWALVVHLHLVLPDPLLGRRHRGAAAALWIAVAGLEAADALSLLPRGSLLLSLAAAIAAALGLLAWRLLHPAPPRWRLASRIMAFGVVFGLVPVALSLAMVAPAARAGIRSTLALYFAFSFLPVWPLSYLYAMYRHDLGTLASRANRAAGLWAFLAVYALAYGLALLPLQALSRLGGEAPGAVLAFAVSLAFVLAAAGARRRFQRLIDRLVFGLRHDPEELVTWLARRIPTAADQAGLRTILLDEVLPTFLIRQSALYLRDDGALYEQQLAPEDGLAAGDRLAALAAPGAFVPRRAGVAGPLAWVRLALPLAVPAGEVGVWLFGRRDPDDFYSLDDVAALSALANQVAPVLENFRLLDAARRELEERRVLEAELSHAHKLEAVGRLSAGIAHDFNNLVAVVLGHCSLLLASGRASAEVRAGLLEIQQAGRRAVDLIRQLLVFSRRGELERRLVDLEAVVGDVARMLRPLLGDEVELEVRPRRPLPPVWIDPGQLGQALINLAANARDAMPSGGRIVIETSAVSVDGTDAPDGCFPAGDYVRLRVSDEGSGMAPELKARIFEPFFTTKGPGRGTGLGLSMVYGFVRQSRGHVEVASEIGRGTRFDLYFPAGSPDPPASPSAAPPPGRPAPP